MQPRVQEVERSLRDADVRLHSDQNDVRPAEHFEFFEERARPATTKRRLCGRGSGSRRASSPRRRPSPFGYCSVARAGISSNAATSSRNAAFRTSDAAVGIFTSSLS